MRQFTHKLKKGQMRILECPVPSLQKGQILVRNYYSVISSGTEGSKINVARKGYFGKAIERPQQAKQVVDSLRSQGVFQTYRVVMQRLDAYSPLGYSSVGEVIDLAPDVHTFKIGDFVGCAGCHAEIVSVPINLCVKINYDADLKNAAYNTLGSIGLQGVRQADLRLGETCAIIGLGLIGQLAAIMLKASGVKVVGVDIDENQIKIAAEHCVDLALNRNDDSIEDRIHQFTNGYGCDAVIIAAGSDSLDPINFAGAISKKKGTIVVVGAVPTGFDREPYYYRKELTIKMSCSYGPGRYDSHYEQKGLDYPYAYVRWTENRNMKAFQDLIYSRKIDISYLTTHVFKLNDAAAAYNMIMDRSEPFLGLLIQYDVDKNIHHCRIDLTENKKTKTGNVNIGFIGAGSYAQKALLPNIPNNKNVVLKGVMTSSSASSRSVAERFNFEFCTSQENDVLNNDEINTVFIATRHDTHANYLIKALESGKHVFVEKPLCLTIDELEEIKATYLSLNNSHSIPHLLVGFNRRFSSLSQIIKERIDDEPVSMIYRINAGYIPKDSWIQDHDIGGGRIIGEVCHFIDYLTFINGSLPTSIYASAMRDANNTNDTLTISISYKNGSIGTILYFANGSKILPKEYIEIYWSGITAILNDFKELRFYGKNKINKKKLIRQDKGQKNEVQRFIDSILEGKEPLISIDEIFSSTLTSIKALESIKVGECVTI